MLLCGPNFTKFCSTRALVHESVYASTLAAGGGVQSIIEIGG